MAVKQKLYMHRMIITGGDANDEDFVCPIATSEIGFPIGRFLYDTKAEAIEAWNRRYTDETD